MLPPGMPCPTSRDKETIKAGNAGWVIRQDDDNGWSINSGSKSRI
jgi:hypothetical protein